MAVSDGWLCIECHSGDKNPNLQECVCVCVSMCVVQEQQGGHGLWGGGGGDSEDAVRGA